jgi:hypothetical protein
LLVGFIDIQIHHQICKFKPQQNITQRFSVRAVVFY